MTVTADPEISVDISAEVESFFAPRHLFCAACFPPQIFMGSNEEIVSICGQKVRAPDFPNPGVPWCEDCTSLHFACSRCGR